MIYASIVIVVIVIFLVVRTSKQPGQWHSHQDEPSGRRYDPHSSKPSPPVIAANEVYEVNQKLPEDDVHLKRLRNNVLGDNRKFEALIEFERRKSPELTRVEWICAAIQRWETDNR